MTSINNYQCHYTLIKKMMTSKPEDRLRKNGVKTRKYYKWLRWSMKKIFKNKFSVKNKGNANIRLAKLKIQIFVFKVIARLLTNESRCF